MTNKNILKKITWITKYFNDNNYKLMIKKKNIFLLFVYINKNILIVIKTAIDKLAVCKKNQVKVKWMKSKNINKCGRTYFTIP